MDLIDKILKLAAETTMPVDLVSSEMADERYNICHSCEKRDTVKDKCLVCKCFIDVKVTCETNRNPFKMRNEITHCPMGKWGDLEIANKYRELDGLPLLS